MPLKDSLFPMIGALIGGIGASLAMAWYNDEARHLTENELEVLRFFSRINTIAICNINNELIYRASGARSDDKFKVDRGLLTRLVVSGYLSSKIDKDGHENHFSLTIKGRKAVNQYPV